MEDGSIISELWCKAQLSIPSKDEEMCAFFITTGWGGSPGKDFLFFFGYNQLCLFSTLILSKLALQMEHAKCSLSKTKPRLSWH